MQMINLKCKMTMIDSRINEERTKCVLQNGMRIEISGSYLKEDLKYCKKKFQN